MRLDRFDLFHGHIFATPDGTPGVLLHASEFPAACEDFPYNLGFCQAGTTLAFSEAKMDWRNLLWFEVRQMQAPLRRCAWRPTRGVAVAAASAAAIEAADLQGTLAALDASEGSHARAIRALARTQGTLAALDLSQGSPLLPALVPEGLRPLRTTFEGDFGQPLGDVYFCPSAADRRDGGMARADASPVMCFPRSSAPAPP